MSRIPVFIEKKARKGWSRSKEACIFIACDSTDSSGEHDESEVQHGSTASSVVDIDHLKVKLFASDDFNNTAETIDEPAISHLEIKAENNMDWNPHSNITMTKDIKEELDDVGGVTAGHDDINKDACLSVAVVSCCKGIIQGKCNCGNCGGQSETLATLDNISSKNAPKVLHSMLPVPTKLKPGLIEITPAPTKKMKEKKKNVFNQNKNKSVVKNDEPSKSKESNKMNNNSMVIDITDVSTTDIADDLNNVHNLADKSEKSEPDCPRSTSRSIHDFEDSEPESTQHEYQKLFDDAKNKSNLGKMFGLKTRDTNNVYSKQAVLKMVHRSSGIPIIKPSRSDNVTPVSRCISVSPRSSVTPRMTISRSSDRPSSSSSNSSVTNSKISKTETPSSVSTLTANNSRGISNLTSNSTKSKQFYTGNKFVFNRKENVNVHSKYPKLESQKQEEGKGRKSISTEQKNTEYKDRKASEKVVDLIKRHLPSAPGKKRVVKYGERCDIDEENIESSATVSQPKSSRLKQYNSRSAGRSSNEAKTKDAPQQKRSDWDLRGRLQDMEEEIKQMAKQNERLERIEHTNSELSRSVAEKEKITYETTQENDQLKKKLRNTEDDLHALKRQLERDTENFEFTKTSLLRQKSTLEGEITALQQEVSGLKASVAQLTSSQTGLQAELESTKLALEQSTKYGKEKVAENATLKNTIRENEAIIDDANQQLRKQETVRRKLHNTIQELKGNIRVFCRVRPLVGDEVLDTDSISHMSFPDDENRTLELEKLGEMGLNGMTMSGPRKPNPGRHQFTFDRVFDPESTQADVFVEISQLVQSALDGYNVCIFAYGQTGSGKTYTMEGPARPTDEETRGMIPRAVVQIFTCVRELAEKGWQYSFEATFLEIYNETIRDLISSHVGSHVKHEIKLGTNGDDVTVTNLTTVPVTQEIQIMELLQRATQNRSVGETQCNERSSRSHSVFRLKISGRNEITGETCCGTLNLVDLAGSEKLKDSGATGQRLKETQNINKSLSNLGNVIMALANKESYIPYRNSKLTYLLQNSLGGNSKTLMFVNVSPKEDNFAETLNSLRFATKVNQCNIGTATRKTK